MTAGCFVRSLGAFFVNVPARAGAPRRGPPPRVGRAPRGLRWVEIGLSFLWKIEITFHFNSELNFGN